MLARMYLLLINASKILTRKGIYPFLIKQLSEIEPGASVLSVGAGGPIAAMVREFGGLIMLMHCLEAVRYLSYGGEGLLGSILE